jgi:pimeloyl-ACP methyl ester carboxylesterase
MKIKRPTVINHRKPLLKLLVYKTNYEKDLLERRLLTSKGYIHYLEHKGTGASVIFLHGLAVNTRTWRKLIAYLPDSISVYLIDLLGHGFSDAPRIEYDVDLQVSVLSEFIERKGLPESFVFGHSYGGWIAAIYAQKGHACKGLILEDPAGLKDYFEGMSTEGTRESRRNRLLEDGIRLNAKEHVIRSILEDDFERDHEHLTRESLASINVPVLIIWGTDDTTVKTEYSSKFNVYIKKSRLELVEGAGHTPHYSNPEKTATLLLDFMAGAEAI